LIKNIERTKESVDSLIDNTRSAVVGATERAERGVEAAADRVVKGTHAAGKAVREGAETASRGAHERVKGAAKAAEKGYVRARRDLSRAATATSEYVNAKPAQALLLAASAGFLAGMLLGRRRRSI
jgi:ElaB/YqjD/DUF883 family membrane-anchored ribosome-binding protein